MSPIETAAPVAWRGKRDLMDWSVTHNQQIAKLWEDEQAITCQPLYSESDYRALLDDNAALSRERNLFKGKNASLLALLSKMRDRLGPITTEIEDEGDRAYFGSTNDADELKEFESDLIDWLIDAEVPHLTMTEDPYAEIREQRARAEKAEHLLKQRERLAKTSSEFWVRAAKSAMNGDFRELRNRVDLTEAEPMEIVQSDALSHPSGLYSETAGQPQQKDETL